MTKGRLPETREKREDELIRKKEGEDGTLLGLVPRRQIFTPHPCKAYPYRPILPSQGVP